MAQSSLNEESIFDQAIRIENPEARSAYLARACNGDTRLLASVEELLASYETAQDYLETPLVQTRQSVLPETVEKIDHYRLIERLGEGGFGVVYRAMQLSPLRREVALKIIRPGMDTEEVVRRFEAERQVLGMINHPHVAMVLDAGATESGRPYFAMELVDGEPVDAYCDRHRLTIDDVLILFIDVCLAIQHAHQKGIVHRDLKPSNVLIATSNGRPIPKVIDFGIAKALGSSRAADNLETGEHRILGTPGYMSPEQTACETDIDTRTDVYALGGILGKLLTGVEPHVDRSPQHVNMAQAQRLAHASQVICPSVRFTSLPHERQREVAAVRRTHQAGLRRILAADLDWIVLRALAADRTLRYSTVQELVDDVQRFRRHEPLFARPPGMAYRCKKFVRRHRLAVVAGLLLAVSIVAGGVASTIGFVQAKRQSEHAERQRDAAVREADKARKIQHLLERMLGAAHPDQGHPADYTLRQLLEDVAGSFESELSDQPEVSASVHRTIGKAYLSLGQMELAGRHLGRALELYSDNFGADHLLTARTRVDHALYLYQVSHLFEAQAAAERALTVLRKYPLDEQTVWALYVLSSVRHEFADYEPSRQLIRQAWETAETVLGAKHSVTLGMQMRLAEATVRWDREEADRVSQHALDALLRVSREQHVDVADAKRMRATIIARLNRLAEAESLLREAMDIHRRQLGADTNRVVSDMLVLTRVVGRSGRRDESLQLARQTAELAERVTVERDTLRFRANKQLATRLESVDPRAAIDVWEKAINLRQQVVGKNIEVSWRMHRRASWLRRLERLPEAAACLQQVLRTLDELDRTADPLLAKRAANRGLHEYYAAALDLHEILLELNRPSDAEAVAEAIRSRASRLESEVSSSIVRVVEARMHLAAGELAEAEQDIDVALTGLTNRRHWRLRSRAALVKGIILTELSHFEDARLELLDTYRILRRQPDQRAHLKHQVAMKLATLFEKWNRPGRAAFWLKRSKGIQAERESE